MFDRPEKSLLIPFLSFLCSTSVLFVAVLPPPVQSRQIDIAGPLGSGEFGRQVTALPNGNFVVIDPDYEVAAGVATGAIHLYSSDDTRISGSPDDLRISTLTGSTPGDFSNAQIIVLSNGNVVVATPNWDNGAATEAGAVTWINGRLGRNGSISAATSLVGRRTDDRVGDSVTALANGNYVVMSDNWSRVVAGAAERVGALTWGSGNAGAIGEVSAGNSVVGTTIGDFVSSGFTELANGHVVLRLPQWDNQAAVNAGAAMWINGFTGSTGEVSAVRALVGMQSHDLVGGQIVALPQGNYFVLSTSWDRPPTSSMAAIVDAGALTWRNGSATHAGIVSPDNSLVGSSADDRIASGGARPLPNGKLLVLSPLWTNPDTMQSGVGAITLISGTGPTSDSVTADNSLTGSAAGDAVGNGPKPVIVINGNVVVGSPQWQGGRGAATWLDASTGRPGEQISVDNSLIGNLEDDHVGSQIVALANGNYVVGCPQCDRGGFVEDVGAAIWGDGSSGVSGVVSIFNSLTGLSEGDRVGELIVPLSRPEGHYVVSSRSWSNSNVAPPTLHIGAATWVDGRNGWPHGAMSPGTDVSTSNSLTGSLDDDGANLRVTALSNGNYVVACPYCDKGGGVENTGAVTWGDGAVGIVGAISTSNSLVGTSAQDRIGEEIFALSHPGGHYVVSSPRWKDVTPGGNLASEAGALSWIDGGNGRPFGSTSAGSEVTVDNSLIGRYMLDGLSRVFRPLSNGDYVVNWRSLDTADLQDAGAVSLGRASQGVRGRVSTGNSVMGTVSNFGAYMTFDYSIKTDQLIVGQPQANLVSLFDDRLFRNSFE